MPSQFIVRRRTIGTGRFNRFLHKHVTTYGKWITVTKVDFGCLANDAARKAQGFADIGIFLRGVRLNPDHSRFIEKVSREDLEDKGLMHQPSEADPDLCRHCGIKLSYVKQRRERERGTV